MRRVLWLSILIFIAGCDGHTQIKGVVQDSEGNPLSGASVRLAELPEGDAIRSQTEMMTSEDGRFSVGVTHAPTTKVRFKLSVSKSGFKSHSEFITHQDRDRPRAIVLEREGQQ